MGMGNITETTKQHLQSALETDDPAEKDFYIRQALQDDYVTESSRQAE